MVRESTPYEPGQSATLVEALRTQSARSLAALSAQAPFATIPNVTLAVDFCPTLKDGVSRDCPVYLSVKQIRQAPKAAARDIFEQSKGKPLVHYLQAERDELAALAPRFKVFENRCRANGHQCIATQDEPATEAGIPDSTMVYADIAALPPDHAGRILTRRTVIINNILSLTVVLGSSGVVASCSGAA